jgi:hypothetical protein
MMKDFQHAAYEAARKAVQSARRNATQELGHSFPDADTESLVPAIDQAMKLCAIAAQVMSQMQQSHSKDKVVAELKRRCPGYTDGTYVQAAHDAFVDYVR